MEKLDGLFSTFEGEGTFWKPDAPDLRLPGTLRFSPEKGPRLNVQGKFPGEQFKHPVIHGLVRGKAVTMHKCYYIGSTGHLGEYGYHQFAKYTALHLFIGAHFVPEETKFQKMKVSLTGLEEWYGHLPFGLEANGTAKYIPYECPKVSLPAIDAALGFDFQVTMGGPGFKEMIWKTRLFLLLESNEPRPFYDYYWTQMRTLQRFLSLLTGQKIEPTQILLNFDKDYSVELFFKKVEAKPDVDFIHMLARFPEIKPRWEEVAQKWFTASQTFESSIILFFGVRYEPVNIQADFLRIMQSVEAFHKHKGQDTIIPDAEYEPIKKALRKAIPEGIGNDLRDSLVARINYGNTMTFKKKLASLLAILPGDLLKLVKFDDIPSNVKQLVDDRDYLTHYDPALKSRISDYLDLWQLGKAIEVILEYLLLKEAGLPEDIFLKRLLTFRHMWFNQPE